MLVMIATLCGEPERADALLQYYEEEYAEIEDLTKNLKEEDKPPYIWEETLRIHILHRRQCINLQ